MLTADLSWTYPAAPMTHHSPTLAAMPWMPATAAGLAAAPADLHAEIDPSTGINPTFHDEVTGLFECDELMFSEISEAGWDALPQKHASREVGGSGSGSADNLLTLPDSVVLTESQLTQQQQQQYAPLATTKAAALAVVSGGSGAGGEASGVASQEAFSPLLGTVAGAGSPAVGSPIEHESPFDGNLEAMLEQQEDLAEDGVLHGGGYGGGFQHQMATVGLSLPASSVHTQGARSQPSNASGKGAAALSEAGPRVGSRRRLPSRRAAAAAAAVVGVIGVDSSDDDETQVRSSRKVAAAAVVLQSAGRTVTRRSVGGTQRVRALQREAELAVFGEAEPSSPAIAGASTSRRRNASGAQRKAAVTAAAAAAAARGQRRPAPSAQRVRSAASRTELKGRSSFADIVEAGFMKPGAQRFAVGNVDVAAAVGDDGAILYNGVRYRAISKFALVVLRERNPSRQSCDGWKEVAWNGEKLDALRVRMQTARKERGH